MSYGRHLLLSIITILIVSSACTVKKRSYQKGYYVDWVFKTPSKNTKSVKGPELAQQNTTEPAVTKSKPSEVVSASSKHNEPESLAYPAKPTLINKDTCGDIMTLKIGEEVRVKVLEITDETIKYKRCDNFDGPLYTIGKEKVYAITYTNGYKEVIVPPVKKSIQSTLPIEKKYPKEVKWAAILTFVPIINYIGIFIGAYLAFKGKRKIMAQPDKYRGLNMAKFILTFDALLVVAIAGLVLSMANIWFYGIFLYIAAFIGIIIAAFYYAFK